MSVNVNGCCDGDTSTDWNPKKGKPGKRGKPFTIYNSLPNPIPAETEDPQELKKFFSDWNLVPYAGSEHGTGQKLLWWYILLAKGSPTHAACIGKKCTYAFGSAPTTIRAKNPEFDTGEELVDPEVEEKRIYSEAFTNTISWSHPVRQFHRLAGQYYQETGNVWVELNYSQVGGKGHAHVVLHKRTHCLYVNTKPNENKMVAVSPIWADKYLRENPPRLVPIYPNFAQDKEGVLHTMFHLKAGENDWYGRPESEAASMNIYSEVQGTFYRIRNAAGDFAGRLIVEMEEENPLQFHQDQQAAAQAAGYESAAERFKEQYTNAGDNPQMVLVSTRVMGAGQMFVFHVPPNNSHQYFKGIGEIDSAQILRMHHCTKRFMSFDVANGFAENAYLEDFVINMEPVINDLRETILIFTNRVISAVWKFTGQMDLDKQSLWFNAPISSQVEQYKKAKQAPLQPAPDQVKEDPEKEDTEDTEDTEQNPAQE